MALRILIIFNDQTEAKFKTYEFFDRMLTFSNVINIILDFIQFLLD